MADIKVNDLKIHDFSGANLFSDSENFMIEIDEESEQILGGCLPGTYYPRCYDKKVTFCPDM